VQVRGPPGVAFGGIEQGAHRAIGGNGIGLGQDGGEMKMGSALKIIRKDKETSSSYVMNREDLIGFLSVSTCLLGFKGITPAMKKSIFELSRVAHATYAATETRPNL
jgi:hypothetical protein